MSRAALLSVTGGCSVTTTSDGTVVRAVSHDLAPYSWCETTLWNRPTGSYDSRDIRARFDAAMSRGGGEQQLDDLYNDLLNSWDRDGPDLNLTPPASAGGTRSDDPRQRLERKQTADSEKLLNLYSSYAVDDTAPDAHYRAMNTPSPTPSIASATPLSTLCCIVIACDSFH